MFIAGRVKNGDFPKLRSLYQDTLLKNCDLNSLTFINNTKLKKLKYVIGSTSRTSWKYIFTFDIFFNSIRFLWPRSSFSVGDLSVSPSHLICFEDHHVPRVSWTILQSCSHSFVRLVLVCRGIFRNVAANERLESRTYFFFHANGKTSY